MHKLYLATTHPSFFTFAPKNASVTTDTVYPYIKDNAERVQETDRPDPVCRIPVPGDIIEAGASVTVPMWIRGPDQPNTHQILFLFYYESKISGPKMK